MHTTPKRGGRRRNAGRKIAGRQQFSVRVKPATMTAIRRRARDLGLRTPGQVLERDYIEQQETT